MNPERRLPHTEFIQLDIRRCKACWRCVEVCRQRVLGKVSVLWHKHAKLCAGAECVGCGKCVRVCEPGAMQRRVSAA